MDHPELIVKLVDEAAWLEERPADAAPLTTEAAPVLASDYNVSLEELAERLTNSHAVFVQAKAASERLGTAAALKQ